MNLPSPPATSLPAATRRALLALSCAVPGLMLWGCASTPEGEPVHGKEAMVSFLASKDGRKLVIVGEKHHYVFDGDPSVASMLRWEGRTKISPAVAGEVKVARNQSFEGQYVLMAFDADLTPEDQVFLTQTGFAKTEVKYGDRTGPALRYIGTARGKRYEAGVLKEGEGVDFSRTHYLKYVEEETATGPAEKAAPTPLGRAADGSLVLGGAPLAVVQGGTDYSCRARFMDVCFFK